MEGVITSNPKTDLIPGNITQVVPPQSGAEFRVWLRTPTKVAIGDSSPKTNRLRVQFFLTELLSSAYAESMNVALYSRVSTKDKGQDVQNQLRQLREFCAKQGWPIVQEFVDHASGKRSDREQFQAMFSAASRREFDTVLFWSLDRFSREGVYETLQHLQKLTAYGVGYRSFTEQYLDSCGLFKDAVISILATIAKQERVRLSERTIAGLQRARQQGRVGGRPRKECDRDRLAELRRSGLSLGQIATQMGLSKTTVARMVTT
jgi:DNA invertase Pin-like site-specific DNA recombinase